MREVKCYECGKTYDYDDDGFCPRCGAFNQPGRGESLEGTRSRSTAEPASGGGKRKAGARKGLESGARRMGRALRTLLKAPPQSRRLPGGHL